MVSLVKSRVASELVSESPAVIVVVINDDHDHNYDHQNNHHSSNDTIDTITMVLIRMVTMVRSTHSRWYSLVWSTIACNRLQW